MSENEQNFRGVKIRKTLDASTAITTLGRTVSVLTDNIAVSYSSEDEDTGVRFTLTTGVQTTILPTAVGKSGQLYTATDGSGLAGTYPKTLAGFGSETIGGNPTLVINQNGGSVVLRSNNVNWEVVSNNAGGQLTPLMTTPVATVAIAEYGDGKSFTTTFTLTNFIVGTLAGDTTNLAIGNIFCAFPAGVHYTTVAYKSISLKCAGTAVAFDCGVGSIIGAGANAVLSGVGATAEDYLTGVATTSSSTGGTAVAQTVAVTAAIATNIAGSIKNMFLNAAVTPNSNNTGSLTASGTITVKWNKLA